MAGSISKVKCPKCKCSDLFLIELWKDAAIYWEQTKGSFDEKDGTLEPGNPYKVEARCKNCDHQWKVRGALQIHDVTIVLADFKN